MAGLIFSIIGWLTCGLLCIPGAFFSFLGLFSRGPKGVAIAGLIVGFPGILFFAFVGLGIIMAVLGSIGLWQLEKDDMANRSDGAPSGMDKQVVVVQPTKKPGPGPAGTDGRLGSTVTDKPPGDLPQQPTVGKPDGLQGKTEGTGSGGEEAGPQWRTWKTADGKFTTEGKFVKYALGVVTLEKRDGTTADVKLSILCAEDQEYVKRRGWTRRTKPR
jgi:hypothetical protein